MKTKTTTIYKKIDSHKYEIHRANALAKTEEYLGDVDYDMFKSKWFVKPYFDYLLEDQHILKEAYNSSIEAGRILVSMHENLKEYNNQLDWDLDRMFIGTD